jgi:hypothetical protein
MAHVIIISFSFSLSFMNKNIKIVQKMTNIKRKISNYTKNIIFHEDSSKYSIGSSSKSKLEASQIFKKTYSFDSKFLVS